ncbi:MAG: helix-turn-helix domain-containing protein [Chloroflexi bacterium]|nr:helix-turn-helix domain-containing protein [Chloroflexota bacterium]
MVDINNLVSVREAARLCNCTAETVRRWIWAGKLPATKLGNQLFVKGSDLARLVGGGKRGDGVARLAALDEARAVREGIRYRIGGNLDVLEAIERSRESHP